MWWVKRNIPANEYALWNAEFRLRNEEAAQGAIAANTGGAL